MSSTRPNAANTTHGAQQVKTGITQAQADEIGRILVREYEENPVFRAVIDAKATDHHQTPAPPPVPLSSTPGRSRSRRGALALEGAS